MFLFIINLQFYKPINFKEIQHQFENSNITFYQQSAIHKIQIHKKNNEPYTEIGFYCTIRFF